MGATNGIFAYNNGSGILSITTTGAVTGTNADGIYASNIGTDLTIQAADVSGSYRGIDARNLGSGALSITATGAVTVNTTGTNTTGIYAYNGINGTDLTIHAADVSGGADGISAANFGSGALSITTTGLVTGSGTAPYNGGIVAFNATSGSDLTIQAAAVSGGSYGIYAQNGGGALSITTTGLVKSTGTATYNARHPRLQHRLRHEFDHRSGRRERGQLWDLRHQLRLRRLVDHGNRDGDRHWQVRHRRPRLSRCHRSDHHRGRCQWRR